MLYDDRFTLDAISQQHRDLRSRYSKVIVGYAYKQIKKEALLQASKGVLYTLDMVEYVQKTGLT